HCARRSGGLRRLRTRNAAEGRHAGLDCRRPIAAPAGARSRAQPGHPNRPGRPPHGHDRAARAEVRSSARSTAHRRLRSLLAGPLRRLLVLSPSTPTEQLDSPVQRCSIGGGELTRDWVGEESRAREEIAVIENRAYVLTSAMRDGSAESITDT